MLDGMRLADHTAYLASLLTQLNRGKAFLVKRPKPLWDEEENYRRPVKVYDDNEKTAYQMAHSSSANN